jgi:hypothetical protein
LETLLTCVSISTEFGARMDQYIPLSIAIPCIFHANPKFANYAHYTSHKKY